MAHVDALTDELRSRLEASGALPRLRASLRAEVAAALSHGAEPPPPAAVPDENLTINELVREYLVFNHYTASLSVLLAETGATGTTALTRGELAMLTGVVDDAHSRRVPLLYELVEKSKATRHGTGPDRHV